MDFDNLKFYSLVGLILAAVIAVLLYGVSWLDCFTYAGQRYQVTVTIQAVEKSNRFWEHTNVWVQVYGEQDITYKLQGYHSLEIGKTYQIQFKNKMVWHWLAGFQVLGKVENIKEAENEPS